MADIAIEELSATLNAIATRLAQVDGSGLVSPSVAAIPSLRREIEGMKETLHQVVLVLDGQLNDVKVEMAALRQLIETRLA